MRTIHQLRNNIWVPIMYACQTCEQTFKTTKYCTKHEEQCKTINTLKKRKDDTSMLIQRITKGGENYYRKGNDGQLFKTKEEAESGKKKGVDNKPCWEGYRYAGTENGKDKCVKVKR